jgi:DNA-binding NarL/FixJ family response regulator
MEIMGSLLRECAASADREDGPGGGLPRQRAAAGLPPPRVVTVMLVVPDGEVSGPLLAVLTEVGVYRTVVAGSPAAVEDVLARRVTGDLAVVSVEFGSDTAVLIRALRAGGWQRVVVFTPTGAVAPVITAVRAGATGVLSRPGTAPDGPADPPAVPALSAREVQVIALVADGGTNKEIGLRLSLSALTVKNHLARLGRKLGVRDRAQLVAVACRAGVIG